MADIIKVPFIKYDPEIKKIASNFLLKYNRTLKIPVPIEEIAEFDFGINIIPIPGLMDLRIPVTQYLLLNKSGGFHVTRHYKMS